MGPPPGRTLHSFMFVAVFSATIVLATSMDEHSLAGDHEATVDLESLSQQLRAQRAAAGFQDMPLSIPTADETSSVELPSARVPQRAPLPLNSALTPNTLGFTPGYGLLQQQQQQGLQGQLQQPVLVQSQNNNLQLKKRLRALEIEQSNLRLRNQIRVLEMRQAQQQSNLQLRSKIQALEAKQATLNSQPERYGDTSFTQVYQETPQVKAQEDTKFAKLQRMQTLLDTMKAEAKKDKMKADAAKKAIVKAKTAARKAKTLLVKKALAQKALAIAKVKAAAKKAKKKAAKAKAAAKKAAKEASKKKKNAAKKKALKKTAKAKAEKAKKAAKKVAKKEKAIAAQKAKTIAKTQKQAKDKIARMKVELQRLRLARKIAEQKAAMEHLQKGAKSRAIANAVARVVAKAKAHKANETAVQHQTAVQRGVKQEVQRLRALKQALQLKRSMLKSKLLRKKKRKLRQLAALKKRKSELKTKRKERARKSKVAAAERKRKHQQRKADKKATKTAAKIAARTAAIHAHMKRAAELRKHAAALTKLNNKQFAKSKAVLAKQQHVLKKIASAAHATVKHLHKKATAGAKRVATAQMHHLNDHRRVSRTHRLVVQQATQQLNEVAKTARAMATAGQSVGGAATRKKTNALARKIQRIADLLDTVNHVATATTAPSAKKQAVMTQSNARMADAGNLPHGWLTNLAAQALHRAQKHAQPASKTTGTKELAHAVTASRKSAPKRTLTKHHPVVTRSKMHTQSPLLKRRLRALNRAKTAMEASVNEMRRLSFSASRKSYHPQESKAAMALLNLDADASTTRLVTTTHSDLSTIVCFQHVHVPLSHRKAAAVEFARRFRSLAEAVTVRGGSVTLHAGFDHRYRLPHNNAKLHSAVNGLKKQRLLRSSAVANLLLLSKASTAGDVRASHALRHASHVMQSLSWTTAELTAGEKTLPGGKVFSLVNALLQSTSVKLTLNDVFADKLARQLRSVEMTYDLTYGTKVKGQLSRGMSSYKASLVKHAHEHLHRDPMRLARTLRLLAVLTRDVTLRQHLRPLFKSDSGALSEVHDTAGRLANLFQRSRHPPFSAMMNQVLLMQKYLRVHMPNKQGFNLAHMLQPVSALYNTYKAKGKFDTVAAARALQRVRTRLKPIVDTDAQKVLSQLPSGVSGALRQVSARQAKAPARHAQRTERTVAPRHIATKAVGGSSKGATVRSPTKVASPGTPEAWRQEWEQHVDVHKATQHDATTEAWLKRLKAATKAVEAVGRHHSATKKLSVAASVGATKKQSPVASASEIAATRAWLKRLARQQAFAPQRHQDRAYGEGINGPLDRTKKTAPTAAPYEPDMSKVRGFVTGGKWAEEATESSPAVVESELPEAEWSDVMSVLTP